MDLSSKSTGFTVLVIALYGEHIGAIRLKPFHRKFRLIAYIDRTRDAGCSKVPTGALTDVHAVSGDQRGAHRAPRKSHSRRHPFPGKPPWHGRRLVGAISHCHMLKPWRALAGGIRE